MAETEQRKTMTWRGEVDSVHFDVLCEQTAQPGPNQCRAFIYVAGTVIAIVTFNVEVENAVSEMKAADIEGRIAATWFMSQLLCRGAQYCTANPPRRGSGRDWLSEIHPV